MMVAQICFTKFKILWVHVCTCVAILWLWSANEDVGGAVCCCAALLRSCWTDATARGRWAWCWARRWWCWRSWEVHRQVSDAWLRCSQVDSRSSRQVGTHAPAHHASSAATWAPRQVQVPVDWWHWCAEGFHADAHHAAACPFCSRVQRRPGCWERAEKLQQRWWHSAR